MKPLIQLLIITLLVSCSNIIAEKHLDERTFTNGDIKVIWYRISEISTIHDFVNIERKGRTITIMKANTGGIHDILIRNDTVTIQTMPDLLVYDLKEIGFDYHIILDTSITICQYMKKHVPENAKYYCDQ
jgi:hypothetical protein